VRVARTALESLQVDVRIIHLVIVRAASPNFQYDRVSIGSTLKVVTICGTGLESCTVPYLRSPDWHPDTAQNSPAPRTL
jgi:hypothetical protein